MEETKKVVPDNMVVLHDGPLEMGSSFASELQPVEPLLVLEYVSKGSVRKDYEDNMRKYERELKVPYYLLFYPETQDLTLFRRGKTRYVSVKPNDTGRLAIPELELEVALLDGWARYWFRGELLDLPADLKRSLLEAKEEARRAKEETRRAKEETRLANDETRQAKTEIDALRAQLRALGVEPNL